MFTHCHESRSDDWISKRQESLRVSFRTLLPHRQRVPAASFSPHFIPFNDVIPRGERVLLGEWSIDLTVISSAFSEKSIYSFKVKKSSMIVQHAFLSHHSWAAQLSFWEEGLLWSTWKATQGRVLPRENPKKKRNTMNMASNFTTAACCVSQRDQDRLLFREQEILRPGCWWLREMTLWGWATWGNCCPVSQWVLSSLPFWAVLWCPSFEESKGTDSNMKDVIKRTASFWESEAWTLWLSELQSLQQAKKHQAEWMESLWWVCYELRNCKQTWHASSGAQQNLRIAQC